MLDIFLASYFLTEIYAGMEKFRLRPKCFIAILYPSINLNTVSSNKNRISLKVKQSYFLHLTAHIS